MANTLTCKAFGELNDDEITSILQLTYQLIASANYGRFSEADDPSINVMMEKLGFTGNAIVENIGNAYWNDAMDTSPWLAFDKVASFSATKKAAFKDAILAVVEKDNSFLRRDIARQIFARTNIK